MAIQQERAAPLRARPSLANSEIAAGSRTPSFPYPDSSPVQSDIKTLHRPGRTHSRSQIRASPTWAAWHCCGLRRTPRGRQADAQAGTQVQYLTAAWCGDFESFFCHTCHYLSTPPTPQTPAVTFRCPLSASYPTVGVLDRRPFPRTALSCPLHAAMDTQKQIASRSLARLEAKTHS